MDFKMSQHTVLLIGHKPVHLVQDCISSTGAVCISVQSAAEADKTLGLNACDVVVIDDGVPEVSVHELIRNIRARKQHRSTPIVLLSDGMNPVELERAVMLGIYASLSRPIVPVELTRLVATAIEEAVSVRK